MLKHYISHLLKHVIFNKAVSRYTKSLSCIIFLQEHTRHILCGEGDTGRLDSSLFSKHQSNFMANKILTENLQMVTEGDSSFSL